MSSRNLAPISACISYALERHVLYINHLYPYQLLNELINTEQLRVTIILYTINVFKRLINAPVEY